MLNLQATKPACSTIPRNTAGQTNYSDSSRSSLPAAPFLPFQPCQGTVHPGKPETLTCPERLDSQHNSVRAFCCCSELLKRLSMYHIHPAFNLNMHLNLAPQEALDQPAQRLAPPSTTQTAPPLRNAQLRIAFSSFSPLKVFQ